MFLISVDNENKLCKWAPHTQKYWKTSQNMPVKVCVVWRLFSVYPDDMKMGTKSNTQIQKCFLDTIKANWKYLCAVWPKKLHVWIIKWCNPNFLQRPNNLSHKAPCIESLVNRFYGKSFSHILWHPVRSIIKCHWQNVFKKQHSQSSKLAPSGTSRNTQTFHLVVF